MWASVALLHTLAASSGSEAMAVLQVVDPTLEIAANEIYLVVVAEIQRNTPLTLLPVEDLEGSPRAVLQTCAGSSSCFARRFTTASSGARYGLIIAAQHVDDQVWVLGLRMVDLEAFRSGRPEEIAVLAEEVAYNDGLEAPLRRMISQLVPRSMWRPWSVIELLSEPPGAEMRVGALVCVAPCTLDRVPLGVQEVSAHLEGFLPASRTINLVADQKEVLRLDLAPEEEVVSQVWFWLVVGGAVVAGAAVGTAVLVGNRDGAGSWCISNDRSACP